ncbi:MAG: hypothetical protein HDQ95_16315 [Roseburia sp.]|nr:hypothetical protein [Roseburia sp.]
MIMTEPNTEKKVAALYTALHKAKKNAGIRGGNAAEREYLYIPQDKRTEK